MTSKLANYINEVLNDNRIFSHEDVIAMDNEEGKYYQKALDYQYGEIGFPMNAELANSSDVVYVHEYTRDDGTVVRAHYRSKAGRGNPNKPVMKSPQEYKSELEKEINDYMDRDVQERYGAGVNKTDKDTDYLQELIEMLPETELEHEKPQTPEIETKYTPLYPSNGMLTGQIEMSHDVSNEIPVVNVQPYTKPSTQPKPISKPYTGREMNMSNIELPERERLGYWDRMQKQIEPPVWSPSKLTAVDKMEREIKNIPDNMLKAFKYVINKVGYPLLSTDNGYKLQEFASKNKVVSEAVEKIYSPNATEYYRISATRGRSVLDGTDDDNMIFTVDKVPDAELKNHILDIIREYRGNRKMMVVQPKEGSRLMNEVKYSRTVVNALKNNLNKKIINLDFTGEGDLYRTLGHAHIYKPYRDRNGNVVITIVDYYDFADTDERTLNGALVKNAYRQQEERELSNYVLLLELKYTPEEWREIRYNW